MIMMAHMLRNKEKYGGFFVKLRYIGLFFIIIFAIISFCYLKPFEKWQWHTEQVEMTKGDIVVYSQWSDRFMWKGNTIYTAYKNTAGEFVISWETNRHRKEIAIDCEKIASKFVNADIPYNDVEIVELSAEEFRKSDYFFMNDYCSRNEVYTFYILNNRYLVSNGGNKIQKEFCFVRVFDIKTKECYFYPNSMIANNPTNTHLDPKELIEPKYFMDSKGRLLCFYKFYNKIYCHRLN